MLSTMSAASAGNPGPSNHSGPSAPARLPSGVSSAHTTAPRSASIASSSASSPRANSAAPGTPDQSITSTHHPAGSDGTSGQQLGGSGGGGGNPRIKKTLADVLASQQGAQSRKRKRVHYSCAECHRRKHRCDRNIPCQPCLDRGLGDSCRPFQDGDEFGDQRDRLKRLEDLVEGLARAHATLSEDFHAFRQGKSGGAGSLKLLGEAVASASAAGSGLMTPTGQRDEDAKSSGVSHASEHGVRRPGKRARMARMGSLDLEREELRTGSTINDEAGQSGLYGGAAGDVLPEGNSLEGGLTREGDSFYGALALPSVSRGVIETQIHGERLELSSNVPLRSASAKVHRLIQEGGAPPNVIDELMSCLPPRQESDAMLEWFFRDINDTRLPLHERTFRASYEEIMNWRWGNLRNEEGDDGARHVPYLSFLFVILAIAKRSEPEDRCASDEEARRGALFYLHCARRSMAIASAVRADHIDVLLAALYGARLLITLRQSAESWSLLGVAIRAAQAIGLHRDGTKLGLDAVTTERRRRLWAMIYYLDRTTSMLLGRPQAIDDKTADTLPPSDVDIDVLPRFGPAPTPQPFPPQSTSAAQDGVRRPPGVFCFVAIRHELAKLIGRIVEHFQDLSKPRNYADVLQIDADLQRFYAALPGFYLYPALRGDDADRSFDQVCPWLPIHRYLVNIEYHYVRNALHRPYLLRSERYKQSREAAFASSKADRIIRREYEREVSWPSNRARNSHLGGVYRKFASTLIAGIELLLDPNGPNATELHETLDDFLNNSTKMADPSQCTKRELAIIKIFKAKAMDPTWCAATATGARSAALQAMANGMGESVQAGSRTTVGQAVSSAPAETRVATTPGGTQVELGGVSDQQLSNTTNGHRLPSSQKKTNDLAQSLLDRLGGMESLQVLNQNQSPSSNSAASLDLNAAAAMSSAAAAPTEAGDNSMIGTTTNGAVGGLSQPLATATPMSNTGGPGDTLAYTIPNTFDGMFDTAAGVDWFSLNNALDANASAMSMGYGGAMGAPTPGGGIPGKEDSEFAGWGTLVEAIVSGQEN